ncbi:MAG: hypothetical protein QOF77_357 [Solirubrobacteraceae bacterium]|nr:hypothetical protein [Solirubrobacteraceae bacterium]
MTPRLRIPFAGAALLAAIAAAPSLAAGSKTHVIKAQNILFSPERITIRPGDRVTWRFLDAPLRSSHTVTSVGPRRFKDLPNGRLRGSFTVRFDRRGTYRFQCTFHPGSMNGSITVR